MVAILGNPFAQKADDESLESDDLSGCSFMYNPSLSDCSSLTEDLDCTQAPDLSPVKRDPALLRERLEACGSRKRQGRKKRQKALNEAAFAKLVENYDEDPRLHTKSYRTAFAPLFESSVNMMVWYHFTNLCEEDQAAYLRGRRRRSQQLPNISEDGVVTQLPLCSADPRSYHPAADAEMSDMIQKAQRQQQEVRAPPRAKDRQAPGATLQAPPLVPLAPLFSDSSLAAPSPVSLPLPLGAKEEKEVEEEVSCIGHHCTGGATFECQHLQCSCSELDPPCQAAPLEADPAPPSYTQDPPPPLPTSSFLLDQYLMHYPADPAPPAGDAQLCRNYDTSLHACDQLDFLDSSVSSFEQLDDRDSDQDSDDFVFLDSRLT